MHHAFSLRDITVVSPLPLPLNLVPYMCYFVICVICYDDILTFYIIVVTVFVLYDSGGSRGQPPTPN